MVKIKKEAVLITPKDIRPNKNFEVIGTFNPAAVRLPNKDIMLYVRVTEKLTKNESSRFYFAPRCGGKKKCRLEMDKFKKKNVSAKTDADIQFPDGTKRLLFISHFRRVVLDPTGFRVKSIDKSPSFTGFEANAELGVEDPRIVKLGKKYFMTYVSLSRQGNVSTDIASSDDCIAWKREGRIFPEINKDVVLFPEKIKGKYYVINRPESGFEFTMPHMWIAESKDLEYWGENNPLRLSKKGAWDFGRVGAGAPPLKTKRGWLLLYHGVVERKENADLFHQMFGMTKQTSVYSVGAALLDPKNPRKLIAKSPRPIISPTKEYEKEGTGTEDKNVVFPTGMIMDRNGKDVLVFCGGQDTVTTVKKIALKDIMDCMDSIKK